MDYNQIVQLIGSVGFPIARCIVMIFFFYKIVTQIETSHNEEIAKITEALNNNTKTIKELQDTISSLKN